VAVIKEALATRKDKRAYSDRREYLIKAVDKRRKALRTKALEYKGSQCALCGYSKCSDALEFHHLEPNKKDFGISNKGYTRSWTKVKEELDKCILVCSNCHREVHAGLAAFPRDRN
jgi:5-methylcytosine-specific restriction endonuclease McrA